MNYADSRRRPATGASLPRNLAAVARAWERDEPLVVSFVGDTPWPNPTVYCDSGKRYAWDFVRGLQVVVAVRAGVKALDAMGAILKEADVVGQGYPVLVDLDAREVAYIVQGRPIALWQVKRGGVLWQQYFRVLA